MDKYTLSLGYFEELNNMMKGMMESNRNIIESNLKLQEFHEERMKGLKERLIKIEHSLLLQQESITNPEKQVIHSVNHINGKASIKMDTSKECKNINISSIEFPNLPILQDANTTSLLQVQARDERQEVNEEDIPKNQSSTKEVKNIIPYLGKVKREDERVQF